MEKGKLYLIPNTLDPDVGAVEAVLPALAIAKARELSRFVVEGERAAWRLLARIKEREALAAVTMELLNEHSSPADLPRLLAPLLAGEDLGLLSEAGLPCIADPGAALVAAAHAAGIRVVPLVGPSSLLLALGASGLDGQRFSFLGYLPQEGAQRRAALAAMDRGVRADGATRLFIETPYRNDRLLADCLEALSPDTMLCVAADLTLPSETLRSAPVAEWRKAASTIGKRPAVFLVGRRAGLAIQERAIQDRAVQERTGQDHGQGARPKAGPPGRPHAGKRPGGASAKPPKRRD
jgi:16S rRNA (cytidine1402-2'-O)-methyltransferase